MPSNSDKQKGAGKVRPAPTPRPKSIRKRKRTNKDGAENPPHYVETNDHSDDSDYVNAGDDGVDNVDNVVDNGAHGGTGASGEESTRGGANSDATEGTSRFSFEIPLEIEPTLVESLDVIMTLAEKRRVWAGEYINLHGFLPQVEGANRPLVMAVKDGQIVSTIENKVVRNIDEWVTVLVSL